MTSEGHLQKPDILAFHEHRLSAVDRTRAVRHLLQCSECRNRLPVPTENIFWNILSAADPERSEVASLGSTQPLPSDYLVGATFRRPPMRSLAFAALLFFAVSGLFLFMVVPMISSESDSAIADMRDEKETGFSVVDGEASRHGSANGEPNVPLAGDDDSLGPKKRDPATLKNLRNNLQRIPSKRDVAAGSKPRPVPHAETRGKVLCWKEHSFGLDAQYTNAGLLLRWRKVSNATKYEVYVSDLDERLIDHFPTSDQVSHLVLEQLAKEKVYRVRLIIERGGGREVLTESRDFKLSDVKSSGHQAIEIVWRRKAVASVRCPEVKE